ncbi:MAG: hypothetical protein QOI24_4259 [Acidobacteriota bacterium]|jgi:hypothetical protein|nr:hypothetical protein [Acidobacteriota bacterium]
MKPGLARSSQFDLSNVIRAHGVGTRGLDVPRGSEQYEGRFGRMFRTLPAANHTDAELKALAVAMVAEKEACNPDPDAEENSGITAGYTYFGQFIDHDLTFDPASSLEKTNDPDGLTDFRTPRFDLDCVYGRGPDDQPYLYRDGGLRMLQGRPLTGTSDTRTRDLPRNNPDGAGARKRALIGDPRNDENVIVSQLQGIFLRFHNAVVDRVTADAGGVAPRFADVQRLVRWHYQWAVLHDFLPTIVGQPVIDSILPHLHSGKSIYEDTPKLRFFHWRYAPFMPIEFAAAAYRFGHSMIRPCYRLSAPLPLFPILGNPAVFGSDLTGFGEFPGNWAIDWTLFFRFRKDAPTTGPSRVQPAYKIDTSIVNPLGNLPAVIADKIPSLAERNLLRGLRMNLPSGQTIARHMGLTPIPDDKLVVGKATQEDKATNKKLTTFSANFADNAPLWYYVLAEAQQQATSDTAPIHLGDVGGRIVAEVFVGLLLGDNHSYLAQEPNWKPLFGQGGRFGIKDLIEVAQTA